MENQENREARAAGSEPQIPVESALETESIDEGKRGQPGWREIFRQAFEKARRSQQPVTSRRELGKDKSKSLLVLAGAAVIVALLFLGVFSSPNKPRRRDNGRQGTPDLGRRVTPGQENLDPAKSATPLLDADLRADQLPNNGKVTAQDVNRTAKPHGPTPLGAPPAAPPAVLPVSTAPEKNQYALNRVDFSDPDLKKQPDYGVGPGYQKPPEVAPPPTVSETEQLRKPSLVFVRSTNETKGGTTLRLQPAVIEQGAAGIHLPPGTRLVARLESPMSTAVKQPVIAVVEYNYERDGEIIVPAGAKAVGQLRQADHNGFVDIKFESLEMPDGSTESLDGGAMGLDFKPIKGNVTGRNTGTKFLVHALTGLGTAAAYLVGNGGSAGFYGPLSESALLRERLANNLGVAGDQQLNQLAANQNIVVTVPGNTRFYIVLQKTESLKNTVNRPAALAATAPRNGMPTLDELRQLVQLKQELGAMYQQGSTQPALAEAPQQ